MNAPGVTTVKLAPGRAWRHFLRHFLEMVAAMLVGMAALAPVWVATFALLGCSELLQHADLHALVMATDMSIGMTLWMRYRGHGWRSIGEMAGAMYAPFIVLFAPYWAGLISGGTMLLLGHVLMLPCMIAVMLHRRDEYTEDHRRHRQAQHL